MQRSKRFLTIIPIPFCSLTLTYGLSSNEENMNPKAATEEIKTFSNDIHKPPEDTCSLEIKTSTPKKVEALTFNLVKLFENGREIWSRFSLIHMEKKLNNTIENIFLSALSYKCRILETFLPRYMYHKL